MTCEGSNLVNVAIYFTCNNKTLEGMGKGKQGFEIMFQFIESM